LKDVLRRKNPYLFKAKNVLSAEMLVRALLDAYLSSQEETLFGNFMEGVAIFVCHQVFGGVRVLPTELTGVDLQFERDYRLYIVEIKSGPHWGNSSQINRMKQNFVAAKKLLETRFPDKPIIAVNGCMYGKEANPNRSDGTYLKLCGQEFWSLISDNETLYIDLIEPLGHLAKQKNEAFDQQYASIVNRFTGQFISEFCHDSGMIDWENLVRWSSQRPT
jgi:hypothetical protein